MTEETLKKAIDIQKRISELKIECERIPRQYLNWRNKEEGYWRRMLVKIKEKVFVKFPQRYEGDKDTLMELTEEDLKCLVSIREKEIKELEIELVELN